MVALGLDLNDQIVHEALSSMCGRPFSYLSGSDWSLNYAFRITSDANTSSEGRNPSGVAKDAKDGSGHRILLISNAEDVLVSVRLGKRHLLF